MTDKDDNLSKNKQGSENFKFIIKVLAAMAVSIFLGMFFIKNLFEENKSLRQFDVSNTLGRFTQLASPPLAANHIRLFYTADGRTLTAETRELKTKLPESEKVRFILKELINGPKTSYFDSTIPPQTEIRGIYLIKDLIVVDLSAALVENLAPGFTNELLAVYSIVNSIIINCQDIKTVKILIDGSIRDVFRDYIETSAALSENVALAQW